MLTREALINCDFSGDVMDGVDRADEYMRDAYLLRDMRKDYELFRHGVDAELLMKVPGNLEMAALLTSLAKTMK